VYLIHLYDSDDSPSRRICRVLNTPASINDFPAIITTPSERVGISQKNAAPIRPRKVAKAVAWNAVVNLKLDVKAPAPQRVTALVDGDKAVIYAENTYWTTIPRR